MTCSQRITSPLRSLTKRGIGGRNTCPNFRGGVPLPRASPFCFRSLAERGYNRCPTCGAEAYLLRGGWGCRRCYTDRYPPS